MMNNWSLPVFSTDDKSLFAETRKALWEENEILPKEQANCPRSSPILMFDQPHTLPPTLKGHRSHQKAPAKLNELPAWWGGLYPATQSIQTGVK